MASGQTCRHSGCNKSVHINKDFCLDHYKEQEGYSYGLDADIKKKLDSKFDSTKAAQAQAWLEELTGIPSNSISLQEYLKSGIVLCLAANKIKPGTVKQINRQLNNPFKERENIAAYLQACKAFGCRDTDLFMTQDLYESANMGVVVDNLHSVGGLSRKIKGFNGPFLGVKYADENKRQFTDDQLKASVPSKQTQGSYGYQVEKSTGLDKIIRNADTIDANRGASAKSCSACGTKKEGAAKFCPNCGAQFT